MDNKLYKLMDWPSIEEIVYSESSHPKRILGGHRTKDGFLVQVFRPDAVQVSISVSERKKKILGALVDEYIKTAEPVGSKAIAGITDIRWKRLMMQVFLQHLYH